MIPSCIFSFPIAVTPSGLRSILIHIAVWTTSKGGEVYPCRLTTYLLRTLSHAI